MSQAPANSIFATPAATFAPIHGSGNLFPVRRIYCVGRNYAAHAREMGKNPARDPPFFFTKWADTLVPSGADIEYPLATGNFQYEVELVLAIGLAGRDIQPTQARRHIFGYAVGLDMTRRDLQLDAREHGRPWDAGKNFDASAPLGPIHPVAAVGPMAEKRIWLEIDGVTKQDSDLARMIWSAEEVICHLSQLYMLQPGDLVFTGTPEGVGPVVPGNRIVGRVAGLDPVAVTVR